ASKSWLVLVLLSLCSLPWFTSNPAYAPRVSSPGAERALKVATVNVHLDTTDAGAVLEWLKASNVDVAVLVEVSPVLAKALESQSAYPFRVVAPRDDPFGLAILSTIEFDNVRKRESLGDTRTPVVE